MTAFINFCATTVRINRVMRLPSRAAPFIRDRCTGYAQHAISFTDCQRLAMRLRMHGYRVIELHPGNCTVEGESYMVDIPDMPMRGL